MKKYLLCIVIFLILLFAVTTVFYLYPRKAIIIPEVERVNLEMRPEIIEEGFQYNLSGFLMENRIRAENYIVLRIDMDNFFINSPISAKDVRILVSEEIVVTLKDDAGGTVPITIDDLKRLDLIDVTIDVPINEILKYSELVAHSQISKRMPLIETVADDQGETEEGE